jgi:tRNA A-37 threonylcarbamoyl transferase component Bud32
VTGTAAQNSTDASGREGPHVVLTDCPWPDPDIERGVIEGAGFVLVAGPSEGASPVEVEQMVTEFDPVAIICCWASVSAAAIAASSRLRVVARMGAGAGKVDVAAATAKGIWVTEIPDEDFAAVSATADGIRRQCVEEVVRVLRGAPPHHPVNRPVLKSEALGGGVASDITIVDTVAGRIVVKQALPELKVKAHWPSDPSRSEVETAALTTIADLLGEGTVPKVLWTDPDRHCFGMELIDARFRNWKADLLAGRIDLLTASRAGELLGELHGRSAKRSDIAGRFADRRFFEELRIVPYFRRIAERNPTYASIIDQATEGMAGSREHALVHGDFSPKNILADGGEIVILDCEVAHWGDPRFDIAFCLSHLTLKSMRRGADAARIAETGETFLAAYHRVGPVILDSRLVRLVGCLVLARIEGDSPVDYLDSLDIGAVKRLAIRMIEDPADDPSAIIRAMKGRSA